VTWAFNLSMSASALLGKLFLCSNGPSTPALERALRELIGAEPKDTNVWYIPTAARHDGMAAMAKEQPAAIRQRFGVGVVRSIDPETVKGDLLRTKVSELKPRLIWAEMGNTYALRHHLRESGGDELIRSLVASGVHFYGASAGAILAGRTVQTAFWKNWDDKTVSGQIDGTVWDDASTARGLDLAGGRSIFPHASGLYSSAKWQQAQAERCGHTDHEVVKLADGEAVIIEGGAMRPVS